jgi:hypothetical protein
VPSLRAESSRQRSIYIIDCIWELFVKVGSAARGDRTGIKLALNTAKVGVFFPREDFQELTYSQRISELTSSTRPFPPTVHVLVLPSRLPLDLSLNLRELDDTEVVSPHKLHRHPPFIHLLTLSLQFQNDGEIPDHMNLLPAAQAENHVRKSPYLS